MSIKQKCIYCLEEKDSLCFKKVEHVMPQSFGKFENNFTLINVVCDDCNQYFGDNLETYLARDTFEGLSRYKLNIKQAKDFKSLGKKSKTEIIINEGPYKGSFAYLDYSEAHNDVLIFPLPQIGFRKDSGSEYKYFRIEDVPEFDWFSNNEYKVELPGSIIFLGISREEAEKSLTPKGFKNFTVQGEIQPVKTASDYECIVQREADQVIRRSIAKIAFNYMAYLHGRDFALNDSFNEVRKFIREGAEPQFSILNPSEIDILYDERNSQLKRVGHLITLDYLNDNIPIIIAQVSLLNMMNYIVVLSPNFRGESINITRGHFFNPSDRNIYELGSKKNY